ncbi:MAG: DNA-binding response regulator, partial [Actinomycetales bacterium]
MTTAASTAPLTRPDGTRLRVLVVDDEPNIAELLMMAL